MTRPLPLIRPVAQCHCSFCGKADYEAEVMIAGPVRVFICDECVDQCREIVIKRRMAAAEVSHG